MSWGADARDYDVARLQAYSDAQQILAEEGIHVRLGPIGIHALRAWSTTWEPLYHPPHPPRECGDWPWDKLRPQYNTYKRFDLAVWQGTLLCGLAIGRSLGKKKPVNVYYAENWKSDSNPLAGSILAVAATAAEAYALLLESRVVRAMHPAPGLVDYYRTLGYHRVPETGLLRYCEKVI